MRPVEARRSIICPTEADFVRTMETYHATNAARVGIIGMLALATVASVPLLGWVPAIAAAVAGVWLYGLDRVVLTGRVRRPEWLLTTNFLLTNAAIAVSVLATGGPDSPILAAFGLPTLLLANRFRQAVTVAGLGLTLVMLLAVTVGVDPRAVADDPTYVVCVALELVCIIVLTLPVATVEAHLRRSAHVDPLTGVLNRLSLQERFAELTGEAQGDRLLSLAVCDLDHFKRVNDAHGHMVGDRVLRRVADLLTKHSRRRDSVFRLGGEEFAMLLPNLDRHRAHEVAEALRAAIAASRPHGLEVTASIGVATHPAATATWLAMYRAADAALLRAKKGGRNRVVVADGSPAAQPPPRRAGDVGAGTG